MNTVLLICTALAAITGILVAGCAVLDRYDDLEELLTTICLPALCVIGGIIGFLYAWSSVNEWSEGFFYESGGAEPGLLIFGYLFGKAAVGILYPLAGFLGGATAGAIITGIPLGCWKLVKFLFRKIIG